MKTRLGIALLAMVSLVFLVFVVGSQGSDEVVSSGAGTASTDFAKPQLTADESGSTTGAGPSIAERATLTTESGHRDSVALSALPNEATQTWRLIEAGGPFPYEKDGSTFQNRERILPRQSRGYYREYTVRTPGESDRGARRLVVGDGDEVFYTADHYDSFVAVDVSR